MEEKKVEQALAGERSMAAHTSPYPWLVFSNEKSQTFFSITENTSFVQSIPELAGKVIHNSSHGWLILSASTIEGEQIQFSLWNPITLEYINNLPPLECKTTSCFEIIVLTSPPSHPYSMLSILDANITPTIWSCFLHDQPHWFKDIYETGNIFTSLVSCKNKIYAIITMGCMSERNLVQIYVNEQNIVALKCLGKLPLPHRKNGCLLRTDLVELRGDLYVISIDYRGRGVDDDCLSSQVIDMEIHKLDLGGSMAWERVTSAPNCAFFLGNTKSMGGSLSVICSEPLGNKIYLFDKSDCFVYSYHIEDRSLSASLPACTDPQTLRGRLHYWIAMPYRSTEIHGETGKNIGNQATKWSQKEAKVSEIVEKESNRRKLVDLPHEIVKLILDCAPTIDYLNMRQASAVCQRLAPALQFETAISRSEKLSNSVSPWLVSLGRVCTLSHPHISDRYNIRVPEELQDAMIWHCRDGWLLVSNNSRGDHSHILIFFFNPFTKRVVRYMEIFEEPLISLQIAFSAAPTSPNCVVVTIELSFTGNLFVNICRPLGKERLIFPNNNHQFLPTYNNPIFSNGAFYFPGRYGNVGVVRLHEEVSSIWQVIEEPHEIDLSFSESFLAERDGEIFLVLAYEMGKKVRVLSLDLSILSWKNVENFGNYTLYVSRSSALFAVAKTSEAENKIYFPRFYGDRLISYSLNTNTIQCCGGTKGSLESYECSTLPLHCGWVTPCWS